MLNCLSMCAVLLITLVVDAQLYQSQVFPSNTCFQCQCFTKTDEQTKPMLKRMKLTFQFREAIRKEYFIQLNIITIFLERNEKSSIS